jgi:hypothetical protein
MMNTLVKAAVKHGEAKVAHYRANLEVYINNPAGIGEHPDVAAEVIEIIKNIAEWEDFLRTAEDL